jgi:hypothetical protein
VGETCAIPLRGPRGEPVDFLRTIISHGVAELPPNKVDLEGQTLETTLPIKGGARTLRIRSERAKLHIEVVAGSFDSQLTETIANMFRLAEDLSPFYSLVGEDGDLAWCAAGAGRMLRAPTVFEDVVKTTRTFIRTPEPKPCWRPGASAYRRSLALTRRVFALLQRINRNERVAHLALPARSTARTTTFAVPRLPRRSARSS